MASSCSLGSMPSRTKSSDTSVPSDSETPNRTENTSGSDTETGEEDGSLEQEFHALAEEYMTVLSSGDLSAVMQQFNISFRDIMYPLYESYELVFRVLFYNLSYSYGSILTTDHCDYDLNVSCSVPDIDACVETVLADEAFMNDVAQEWVKSAVADYDSTETLTAYETMRNSILIEALRRIVEEEFTDKIPMAGFFRFHDNGGHAWLCTRTPDFVKMCAQDNYMPKLVYITPVAKLDLIKRVGELLTEDKTIKKKALEEFLETRTSDILGE